MLRRSGRNLSHLPFPFSTRAPRRPAARERRVQVPAEVVRRRAAPRGEPPRLAPPFGLAGCLSAPVACLSQCARLPPCRRAQAEVELQTGAARLMLRAKPRLGAFSVVQTNAHSQEPPPPSVRAGGDAPHPLTLASLAAVGGRVGRVSPTSFSLSARISPGYRTTSSRRKAAQSSRRSRNGARGRTALPRAHISPRAPDAQPRTAPRLPPPYS